MINVVLRGTLSRTALIFWYHNKYSSFRDLSVQSISKLPLDLISDRIVSTIRFNDPFSPKSLKTDAGSLTAFAGTDEFLPKLIYISKINKAKWFKKNQYPCISMIVVFIIKAFSKPRENFETHRSTWQETIRIYMEIDLDATRRWIGLWSRNLKLSMDQLHRFPIQCLTFFCFWPFVFIQQHIQYLLYGFDKFRNVLKVIYKEISRSK